MVEVIIVGIDEQEVIEKFTPVVTRSKNKAEL